MTDEPRERKHPLAICEDCPLYDKAFVPSTGPKAATVAVISRSPGWYEAQKGRPFAGQSGQLLDALLEGYDHKRSKTRVTNVVMCECEEVPLAAMNACRPRLLAEVAEAQTIIACGAEAALATTGHKEVVKRRGYDHEPVPDMAGKRVIVTYNPAAAIRNDAVWPDIVRDFKLALAPVRGELPTGVVITSRPAAEKALTSMPVGRYGIDLETVPGRPGGSGLDHDALIASIAFGYRKPDGRLTFVAIGGDFLKEIEWLHRYLRPVIENRAMQWIWWNGKFDCKVLRHKDIDPHLTDDGMAASYSLDERQGSHSLEYRCAETLGWPDYEPERVKRGKKDGHFDDLEELCWYNGVDAAGTINLHEELWPQVEDEEVTRPYRDLLLPASDVLADVERHGALLDAERAKTVLESEIKPYLVTRIEKAERIIGRAINLNSPKQISELIYDEWGIKSPGMNKKVKKSTDAPTLDAWLESIDYPDIYNIQTHDQVQFLQNLLDFRTWEKLRGTYFEGLLKRQWPSGRVHTNFKWHGTETGRLSGEQPNLQNQTRPDPNEVKPNVRQLFIAPPERVILQADYSQAELRVAAVLSADSHLQQVYRDGRDLHSEVATDLIGPNFNKEDRVKAKAVNFGILFGQTPHGFAKLNKTTLKEAERWHSGWWMNFPGVAYWVDSVQRTIREEMQLQSVFGRKRRFHLLTKQNIDHSLRAGVNFMIQSPASDLCLWSMIQVHYALRERGWLDRAHIIITVHDSIVLEVAVELWREVAALVKDIMESAPKQTLGWDFPFVADISVGQNWGFVHDVDMEMAGQETLEVA